MNKLELTALSGRIAGLLDHSCSLEAVYDELSKSILTLGGARLTLELVDEILVCVTDSGLHLKSLKIAFSNIDRIPESVLETVSLERLLLMGNRIRRVHDGIGRLKNLTSLRMNHNEISRLPSSICELPMLEHLELQSNRLSSLPGGIGKLSKLRVLCLRHNRLYSVPGSFKDLDTLTHLYLEENLFQHMPKAIITLPSLRLLHISCNQLSHVDMKKYRDLMSGRGIKFIY